MSRRALFVYFPHCEVLDFAGPLQTLHEANAFTDGAYEIIHCGAAPSAASEQGLVLASLQPLPPPRSNDLIFVPGYPVGVSDPSRRLGRWLREAHRAGAHILATCTGAFVLA